MFVIPQIPGYRHGSHSTKTIDESFVTTIYAIPIALMNPYLAGGLFVDYLVRGRYHLIPKNPTVLGPDNLTALTAPSSTQENSASAGIPASERCKRADQTLGQPQRQRPRQPIQTCKEREQ